MTVAEGDILLVRTGLPRRLHEVGPWNTAVSKARDPVLMAKSMCAAVEAGRMARLAGRIPKLAHAEPSSPQFGLVGT